MAVDTFPERRWNRSKYPLQASSHSAVRSPPSSPDEQNGHHGQLRQDGRYSLGKSKAYPLQSPASTTALRAPPTPSLSSQEGDITTDHEHQHGVQTYHRQQLPSRSSGEAFNLHHPPSPPLSPEPGSEVTDQTFTGSATVAKTKTKTLRRQAYPLQAQASIADLTSSSSGLGSSVDELKDESDPPKSFPTSARKPSRRQYPLQNKVSVANLESSPSGQESSQIPVTDPPFDRAPKADFHATHEQGPIHLPKNIRAATDSKKHESGGRTIVICLDGTGDKFDNDNSNIVHIVSALKKDDANQVSYYQAGIGTYGEGGLSGGMSAAMDMAVGSGLGMHVREAYQFLMHSYKENDKVCIFGFSRGAYTARCLAGMVHKVGLLPARNLQQIPFAYDFYKDDSPAGWKQSEDFKRTFCIDVNVYFLGCFDSVSSVGFIPRVLPLSSTPTSKPRYFRHAMALDERRAKFKICRHEDKDWEDIKNATTQPEPSHADVTDEEYKELMQNEAPFDTDVREVWFAGAHADVGGGAVPNAERHKLAQIPLRWMIRQAFECNTGIIFKTKVLVEYGLDVHELWPIYRNPSIPSRGPPPSLLDKYDQGLPSRSVRGAKLVPTDKHEKGEQLYHFKSHTDEDWTPEHIEDFFDAVSPMNDQLIQAPNWWMLEFFPVQYKVPIAPGNVLIRTGMNLGRYRGVEEAEPCVHWTVKHREQHLGYKIQARTAPNTTWQSVV